MTMRLEVASRIFNCPLAIDPGKAVAIVRAIGPKILDCAVLDVVGAEPVDYQAGKLGNRLGDRLNDARVEPYEIRQGVAIIPVEGTLVHKGAFVGKASGRTSYQGIQFQAISAMTDDRVKGVVFEVDSFGGEVAGAFETADVIRRLSQIKPTMAILTDHALSAGYMLASGARQIVMPETGRVGSIGVITLHADISQALEKDGVVVTIVAAGSRKADRNPYQPLPKEVEDRMRAEVERDRLAFANLVGRNRGFRMSAQAAMETEADSFDGATAYSLGLVDAVGHANDVFNYFVRAVGHYYGSL